MNMLTWLDESFSLRFVITLLHFLWQGVTVHCSRRICKSSSLTATSMRFCSALMVIWSTRRWPFGGHHAARGKFIKLFFGQQAFFVQNSFDPRAVRGGHCGCQCVVAENESGVRWFVSIGALWAFGFDFSKAEIQEKLVELAVGD